MLPLLIEIRQHLLACLSSSWCLRWAGKHHCAHGTQLVCHVLSGLKLRNGGGEGLGVSIGDFCEVHQHQVLYGSAACGLSRCLARHCVLVGLVYRPHVHGTSLADATHQQLPLFMNHVWIGLALWQKIRQIRLCRQRQRQGLERIVQGSVTQCALERSHKSCEVRGLALDQSQEDLLSVLLASLPSAELVGVVDHEELEIGICPLWHSQLDRRRELPQQRRHHVLGHVHKCVGLLRLGDAEHLCCTSSCTVPSKLQWDWLCRFFANQPDRKWNIKGLLG
mmetsp:Transcript_1423/g.2685  ORF Transcript_1423/g.2685 Transcript_1423/m.2685 type:complete len:279 (-) Transcript_1423:850-1686(-)